MSSQSFFHRFFLFFDLTDQGLQPVRKDGSRGRGRKSAPLRAQQPRSIKVSKEKVQPPRSGKTGPDGHNTVAAPFVFAGCFQGKMPFPP